MPALDAAEPPGAEAPGPDASYADAGFSECSSIGCEPNGTCRTTPLPAGTVCRAAAGDCDLEEVCDGVSLTCPAGEPAPKATFCGDNAWCTGTSKVCPQGSGQWKVFPSVPNDRWYWTNPLPQGYGLYGVWGSAADDVWAVGDGGTLLHWDGFAWTRADLGRASRGNLGLRRKRRLGRRARWVDPPLGRNRLERRSERDHRCHRRSLGQRLRRPLGHRRRGPERQGPALGWQGVGGRAEHRRHRALGNGQERRLGGGGAALGRHEVGHGQPGTGEDVRLLEREPHRCVGQRPRVPAALGWRRLDRHRSHRADDLLAGIWGTGASDVWAVGREFVDAQATGESFPGNVVFHWDGTAWTRVETRTVPNLAEVWGSGATDVWAVGQGGGMLHWDGTRWISASAGTQADVTCLRGMSGDYWAASYHRTLYWLSDPSDPYGALHWTGGRWRRATVDYLGRTMQVAVGGPDDVWFLGEDWATKTLFVHRWDGKVLTAAATSHWPQFVGPSDAVSRAPEDPTRIDRWDGTKWSPWKTFSGPVDVVANRPDNIWTLTANGWSAWDGATWTNVTPFPSFWVSLWPVSKDFAWLVAYKTFRWNGTAWDSVELWPGAAPDTVWGGSDEAWAVGSSSQGGGMFAHWNGASWEKLPWKGPYLGVVWGTATDDVWVSGFGGTILHRK